VDQKKEKISFYKEYLKILMFLIITIMSGIVINLFNVFIKKMPFYSLLFSLFGIIILLVLLVLLKKLHLYIEDLIEEL